VNRFGGARATARLPSRLMQVLFVAAECEPWAKIGGLGDVVDALARALGRIPGLLDESVEVFLPRYPFVAIPAGTPLDDLCVGVPDGDAGTAEVTIRSFDAGGYRLRLVDYPPCFDRSGVYGDGPVEFPDNARRFTLLGRAALEARRHEGRPVDVIAIHDWHACPVAILRDIVYADDPILGGAAITLTVHNPAYHGWTPRERAPELGLGAAAAGVGDGWGIDLLAEGIRRAEMVNTVSPTYAREVLTPEAGQGLDGDLASRGDRFIGILNGLDQALWDPATDAALAARYDVRDPSGKAACRRDLLARVGFDPDDPGPVLGVIGRLDPQKGFDLVAGALPRLLAAGARLVALGSGDPRLVMGMRSLAGSAPRRVAMLERFDRDLARRIYAGADLFLMPSRFEPCGQGQMIAMRYGTPPVARRTGGLADTIRDVTDDPDHGTGFLFGPATPEALADSVERALAMLAAVGAADRAAWAALVVRCMTLDWAWESTSAPAYAAMFRRAIARRRAARTDALQGAPDARQRASLVGVEGRSRSRPV
jgi:starch synthase